jgi:WAS/WASL-interacting protein
MQRVQRGRARAQAEAEAAPEAAARPAARPRRLHPPAPRPSRGRAEATPETLRCRWPPALRSSHPAQPPRCRWQDAARVSVEIEGIERAGRCQGKARVRNAAAAKRAPWSDRQRAVSGARGAQLLHAPRAVGAQRRQRCVVLWAARGCSARRQRKRGHRAAAAPQRVPSRPGASHDAACGRRRRRRARGGCNGGSARRSGKRRRTQKAQAVAWRRRALRLDEDVQAQQHRLEPLRRRGGVVLRKRAAREARRSETAKRATRRARCHGAHAPQPPAASAAAPAAPVPRHRRSPSQRRAAVPDAARGNAGSGAGGAHSDATWRTHPCAAPSRERTPPTASVRLLIHRQELRLGGWERGTRRCGGPPAAAERLRSVAAR